MISFIRKLPNWASYYSLFKILAKDKLYQKLYLVSLVFQKEQKKIINNYINNKCKYLINKYILFDKQLEIKFVICIRVSLVITYSD